jgi:antitoxin (DNA-binding transcriptional repressor) of toxin-antitoxin stability system
MMMQLNAINTTQSITALLTQLEDGEPIVLNQDGEEVAALITIRDLNLLRHLIEAEEDRIDSAEAAKILSETKEEDWIPFEGLKAELSL